MSFNMIAGLAYDSFLFQNTKPIACNYGGTGTATYDPTTNVSVVSVTDCAMIPWSVCTGSLQVSLAAVLPLVSSASVFVSTPYLECVGTFSDYRSDIFFVDASSIFTPFSEGAEYILSGKSYGTITFPTFTIPIYSNMQNLTVTPVPSGNDLIVVDATGTSFNACFGKWYAYGSTSGLTIHGDGTTTGTLNIMMTEITDIVETVLNTDGSLSVNSTLSGSPVNTAYPNYDYYYSNCAGL